MISFELLLWCLLASGVYLLAFSLLFEWLGARLRIARGLPDSIIEPTGIGWFLVSYIMEVLFMVAMPTLAYGFFYIIIPLSGLRAALGLALLVFTFGAVPMIMGLSLRLKLSLSYLLYCLLGYFLKLVGSLIIIGAIYSL